MQGDICLDILKASSGALCCRPLADDATLSMIGEVVRCILGADGAGFSPESSRRYVPASGRVALLNV